ncbi:hypothetical protein Ga0466249_001721 [Sporomusaceae bacterium BoRhaA]|uniref:hypothetical protein n=1 Tax=Pelorhabdus rhamnosifermentans TaxID=2772457 RepID=UPI001C062938|nr:hypothetical protein [Pelorhabdus rhamnosifermentans]MBU2700629.1 hypothetical protein [Pelorhabdus rhamnosifermentans]
MWIDKSVKGRYNNLIDTDNHYQLFASWSKVISSLAALPIIILLVPLRKTALNYFEEKKER